MRRIILFFVALLSLPVVVFAYSHTISVKSQLDFDKLNESIALLLENSGEQDIRIVFSQGVYNFHDDHLSIINVESPDATLSFEGNGSVIMSDGGDYVNGSIFSEDITMAESFVTVDGQDLNSWSKMLRASNSHIEVVDESTMLCRLDVSGLSYLSDKGEEECRWMYIWIPQWYYSRAYKVSKIDGGYIYFTTFTLHDINYDYSYGKISELRFRLSNNPDVRGDILIKEGHIYLPENVNKVRHAKADCLCKIYNSKLRGITLNGFKIYGNTKKDVPYYPDYNDSKQLIDVTNFKSDRFRIAESEFRSIQTRVVNLISTNNVEIENCNFEDCYSYCVFQDRASRGFSIHDCTFHNINKRINNTIAIFCRGADFHVYDNLISDFGYCAIAAGIWHGHPDVTLNCNGVIERNEVYYTLPYYEAADEYNLMDSGAIYLYTITNSTVIRYNKVHHYGGAGDNRGIFCDDGAKNFHIYGNTITNLTNSYRIDSRRVGGKDELFGGLNVNNVIRDNIVDGPIRFQGNEMNNNGCIFEGNIHLDGNFKDDVISNVNQ